jgi:hypothetical protein
VFCEGREDGADAREERSDRARGAAAPAAAPTTAEPTRTLVDVADRRLLEQSVDLEQLGLVGDRVLDDLGGGRVKVLLRGRFRREEEEEERGGGGG